MNSKNAIFVLVLRYASLQKRTKTFPDDACWHGIGVIYNGKIYMRDWLNLLPYSNADFTELETREKVQQDSLSQFEVLE